MRKTLGLYANLRPAKVIPQLIDASTLKVRKATDEINNNTFMSNKYNNHNFFS